MNSKNIKIWQDVTILICMVVLCLPHSKAQMISTITTSSERTITSSISSMTHVVKALAVDKSNIISLGNYPVTPANSAAIFTLTRDATTSFDVSYMYGYNISDFDINDDYLYFCGRTNYNKCFIALEKINTLFSTSSWTFNRYDLIGSTIPIKTIDKLYYYVNTLAEKKLAMIANGGSLFIDFNLSTMTFKSFETTAKLLDIAITKNYVGVLGRISNTEFVIYSHKQSNMANIMQTKYTVPYLYSDAEYRFSRLKKSTDDVVVGYSSERNNRDEFCWIDISTMSIVNVQAATANSGKPRIKDLEYDDNDGGLLCLSNGIFGREKSTIYQTFPYMMSNTVVPAVTPNMTSSIEDTTGSLISLEVYDANMYLAIGRADISNYVFWFDKVKNNFAGTNCFTHDNLKTFNVNTVAVSGTSPYINFDSGIVNQDYIISNATTGSYNIDCVW